MRIVCDNPHHDAGEGLCVHCAQKRINDVAKERDEEQAQKEHILGLLRDTKMEHGTCEPRSRKACTACNAQEELDKIVKDWKGFTMVLS